MRREAAKRRTRELGAREEGREDGRLAPDHPDFRTAERDKQRPASTQPRAGVGQVAGNRGGQPELPTLASAVHRTLQHPCLQTEAR